MVCESVQHEMAVTLSDFLFRRTAIGQRGHPGRTALGLMARTMAEELDWPEVRVEREMQEIERRYEMIGAESAEHPPGAHHAV